MIQELGKEEIVCLACGDTHLLRVLAFSKELKNDNRKVLVPDFYHWCDKEDKGFQTPRDNIKSYIESKKCKQQLDQPAQQSWSIQFR